MPCSTALSSHDFYPRPPRGERRLVDGLRLFQMEFLSTPSARRATHLSAVSRLSHPNFYPRPPRGERLYAMVSNPHSATHFYPRPPRGERPGHSPAAWSCACNFYPRPPRGERRGISAGYVMSVLISIHALREESDVYFIREQFKAMEISIHALREESDSSKTGSNKETNIFLSTPSARRATLARPTSRHHTKISIHALREESDKGAVSHWYEHRYFYPRPPRGERHQDLETNGSERIKFLSTPSARRATRILLNSALISLFLSTPSARRATAKTETKSLFSYKLYNILHEFRRALIYNGSKNDPNHAK